LALNIKDKNYFLGAVKNIFDEKRNDLSRIQDFKLQPNKLVHSEKNAWRSTYRSNSIESSKK